MRVDVESVPLVRRAYRLGVNPVTTTIVLLGPIVIALVALLGRNPLTVALGVAYVLSLPASVAYIRLADGEESRTEASDGESRTEDADDGSDEERRNGE